MKRLFIGAMLLGLVIAVPIPTQAGVGISISVPPPLVFASPPEVVVIPETYVYAVPTIEEDLFFYSGWWWRPWQGRWYRSRDYRSGWVHYRRVPSFYVRVHSGWRNDYRERRWRGNPWNHEPIPYQNLHRNWRGWERTRHWEKQNTWGVQGLKYRPHSREDKRQKRVNKQQVRKDRQQSREDERQIRKDRQQSRVNKQQVRKEKQQSREDKQQSREDKQQSREDRQQSREDKQ